MVYFLVVDAPSAYNVILGRATLNAIGAVISPAHLKLKFLMDRGVGEERGHQQMTRDCYLVAIKGKGAMVHSVEKRQDEGPEPRTRHPAPSAPSTSRKGIAPE